MARTWLVGWRLAGLADAVRAETRLVGVRTMCWSWWQRVWRTVIRIFVERNRLSPKNDPEACLFESKNDRVLIPSTTGC
jgi:hypothetical protein